MRLGQKMGRYVVWLYAIVEADSEQEARDIAVKHLYTTPKTIEYEIEEVEDYDNPLHTIWETIRAIVSTSVLAVWARISLPFVHAWRLQLLVSFSEVCGKILYPSKRH